MDWAFHPKPQTDPVAVESVCPEEKGKRYVSFRNAGGGALNSWLPSTKPLPTIMRGGGVQYYTTEKSHSMVPLSVLIPCASFPKSFKWAGNKLDITNRIGNCVPPLLMKAIAENIRKAPFMKDIEQPTVISTFAGCGGSSLGYKMAGFKELLAVEWDDNAVETFKLNFPEVPVYHGDIAKLTGAECMRLAGGLKPGELDVFDGSPPCQGFSTAGKRKFDDPRNSLFKEYARLLAELQPKAFVMENVTGMIKGHMKQAYLKIMATLRGCGYTAKGEVMNAMYYGVPQARQRVIIIGVRNDLMIEPTHPKPQTEPIAIMDGIAGADTTGTPPFNDKYAMLYDRVPAGGNAQSVIGKGFNNCVKPHPRKPSPTLPKTQTGRGFATIAHPIEKRALSIGEAKRIGSFPDDFKLTGNYSTQFMRIGNSVPPLLMKAIAEHIRKAILMPISRARIASGTSETAVPCLAKAGA